VEVARGPGDPEPSQGSHFFHNLVALGVGYAHISASSSDDFVDWDYLRKNSRGSGPVRLACFKKDMVIVMDGKNGLTWLAK
jgi:hypothetical protein